MVLGTIWVHQFSNRINEQQGAVGNDYTACGNEVVDFLMEICENEEEGFRCFFRPFFVNVREASKNYNLP